MYIAESRNVEQLLIMSTTYVLISNLPLAALFMGYLRKC
jgi:hypothetical protein